MKEVYPFIRILTRCFKLQLARNTKISQAGSLLNCLFSLDWLSGRKMVCIPCIVVPVLLFIWHRFLQPLLLKFWNPWRKVTGQDGTEKSGKESSCPASNGIAVKNGGPACPFSGKKTEIESQSSEEIPLDKKNDWFFLYVFVFVCVYVCVCVCVCIIYLCIYISGCYPTKVG